MTRYSFCSSKYICNVIMPCNYLAMEKRCKNCPVLMLMHLYGKMHTQKQCHSGLNKFSRILPMYQRLNGHFYIINFIATTSELFQMTKKSNFAFFLAWAALCMHRNYSNQVIKSSNVKRLNVGTLTSFICIANTKQCLIMAKKSKNYTMGRKKKHGIHKIYK